MRRISPRATASPILAVGAALFVTLVGCTADGPIEATKVVLDGEQFTIDGPASCVRRNDGKLVINAPSRSKWSGAPLDGGKKLIRVVLTDAPRLVVESTGLRLADFRGFSDSADEMWATKTDNKYTINGRMAPEDGATTSHLFKIEVTCVSIEKEYVPNKPPSG